MDQKFHHFLLSKDRLYGEKARVSFKSNSAAIAGLLVYIQRADLLKTVKKV